VRSIEEARRRLAFDVWAYVIVPEHAHLLIRSRNPEYRISSILWRIKTPVGRQAIEFLKQEAPDWLELRLTVRHRDGTVEHRFWQAGGGYDRNVVGPAEALTKAEYAHANPVRRGLVERPEDWEWSSARWYAGVRDGPLAMDPFPSLVVEGA
jgi:putative transposase